MTRAIEIQRRQLDDFCDSYGRKISTTAIDVAVDLDGEWKPATVLHAAIDSPDFAMSVEVGQRQEDWRAQLLATFDAHAPHVEPVPEPEPIEEAIAEVVAAVSSPAWWRRYWKWLALAAGLVACNADIIPEPLPSNAQVACSRAIACEIFLEHEHAQCVACLDAYAEQLHAKGIEFDVPALERVDCETLATLAHDKDVTQCVAERWRL